MSNLRFKVKANLNIFKICLCYHCFSSCNILQEQTILRRILTCLRLQLNFMKLLERIWIEGYPVFLVLKPTLQHKHDGEKYEEIVNNSCWLPHTYCYTVWIQKMPEIRTNKILISDGFFTCKRTSVIPSHSKQIKMKKHILR